MTARTRETRPKRSSNANKRNDEDARRSRADGRGPTSGDLHAGLSELHRTIGNRALGQLLRDRRQPGPPSTDNAPPIVQEVLGSPGRPLPPDTRARMESRFGRDFDDVRLHVDGKAAESASALGASAYAAGTDIVLGAGQYAPGTPAGERTLSHELAHVVQSDGRTPASLETDATHDRWERNAELIESASQAGGEPPVPTGAPPAIRLRGDPELGAALERIRNLPLVIIDPDDIAERILAATQGIDLTDPDNLRPVTNVVAARFPDALTAFLTRVEARAREAGRSRRREPTEAERAQMERTIRLMQVGRRGPYGMRGPGVLAPVYAHLARDIPKAIVEAIGNAFASAAAFLQGLIEGLADSLTPDELRRLSEQLLGSTILSTVFPPVFLAGAVVGVGEEIASIPEAVRQLIENFDELVTAATEIVQTFFSPEGRVLAREMGKGVGQQQARQIRALIGGNVFEFTYGLGRMAGPLLLDVVIAVIAVLVPGIGIGAVLARLGTAATRVVNLIVYNLRRFPRLVRLANRLRRRGRAAEGPTRARGGGTAAREPVPDVSEMVERGIVEEAQSTPPARRRRPIRPATTGRAAAARRQFERVRDEYARRLGVSSGGQVHHAIELQALDRYPGVFGSDELNAFRNMRGIATELAGRRQLHNAKIRELWDRHYRRIDREIVERGLQPGTSEYETFIRRNLIEARDEIDYLLGQFFTEYRTGRPRSFD